MTKNIFFSLGFFLILKLIWGSQLGLAEDEAYYWVWSKNLDLGYFDHPPMIAWWIHLGSALLGDTELGVRITGAVFGTAALIFISMNVRKPILAIWILGSMPLFALGGILATPDVPLILFWCAAIWAALEERWIWLGVSCGLACLSKYSGAMLLPLALMLRPGCLKEKGPWIAMGIAAAFYAPNAWWNIQNDGISWEFQFNHVNEAPQRASFILGQFFLAGPIIFITAICWLFAKSKNSEQRKLKLFFGVPLLVAVYAGGEANWAAPAYAGLAMALANLDGKWVRAAWYGVSLNMFISSFVLIHSLHPLMNIHKDPTLRLRGGQTLGDSVKAWDIKEVRTARYQEAAWIHFYSGVEASTLPGAGRMSQYDLWKKELPESGLYVRPMGNLPPMPLIELGYEESRMNYIFDHVDAPNEGDFIQTHAWQSYLFKKKDEQ